MSKSLVFQLGPLSLPFPWLLFVLFALAGAALLVLLLRRQPELRRRALDVGSNALLAYLAGWKLSPLLTAFETVVRSPLALFYLPGGATGILVGLGAGALVLTVGILRTNRPSRLRTGLALSLWSAVVVLGAGGSWLLLPTVAPLAPGSAASAPIGNKIGDRAPLFTLAGLEDRTATFPPRAASASGVTVLNFWATWCPPCRSELPEIASFAGSLAPGAGARSRRTPIRLYAINLTSSESGEGRLAPPAMAAKIRTFLQSMGAQELIPHVLLDIDGSVQQAYGITAVPTTIVIADGRIVAVHPGVVTASWLRQATRE